ncbi:MAG: hypothetical protein V3W18_13925 [candidate division Zixibacteria bacterium]
MGKRKQELYKLIVAHSDIYAALYACELFIERIKEMRDPLYFPLLSTIIIFYSKPLTVNKPFGKLSPRWYKYDNEQHKKIHKMILEMRDKVVAHSDLEIRKVHIVPPFTKVSEFIEPSDYIGFNITTQILKVDSVSHIREMCKAVGNRILKGIEESLEEIYGKAILPPYAFELTFDDNLFEIK